MLSVCRDNLELISPVEFIDLSRLQEDRNRCAHPSMTIDSEIFNPSAELSRMHIRSAVEHLLQHPPAQGKYALDTLTSEVSSEYFPTDISKAIVAFESSPLKRARDSLVRNFTLILLKRLINETIDFKEMRRLSTALNAIGNIHRERYRATLTEKHSSIVRGLEAENLDKLIPIIVHVKDSWSHLDADVKQKFELYVESLPESRLDDIGVFLSMYDLQNAAQKRISTATMAELDRALFFLIPPQVSDRIIELYSNSQNFDQANRFASTIIKHTRDYSKEQIRRIIEACGENSQIEYSNEIRSVINALRKNENINADEIDEWLLEAELDKFTRIKDD